MLDEIGGRMQTCAGGDDRPEHRDMQIAVDPPHAEGQTGTRDRHQRGACRPHVFGDHRR
jgi:hypothetical protein